MKIPQWSPQASGSQPWLHIRITWGILTKHNCPGFVPDQLSQNLLRRASVSIIFKAPQVILICSPGWEPQMQVNVKGPLMSEEQLWPTVWHCLDWGFARMQEGLSMLTSGKSQGNKDKLATLAGGREILNPSLVWEPAAYFASREPVARCQERWISGPALPLNSFVTLSKPLTLSGPSLFPIKWESGTQWFEGPLKFYHAELRLLSGLWHYSYVVSAEYVHCFLITDP